MSEIIEFKPTVRITPIELTCGHIIYVTKVFEEAKRKDGKNFYCTMCGLAHSWNIPKVVTNIEKKKNTDDDNIIPFTTDKK